MLITTLVVLFYKDGRGSVNVKLSFLVVYVRCDQIFGNNFNDSKLYPGRSQEQIEVGECLLLFGAEALVLPFVIQKLKD